MNTSNPAPSPALDADPAYQRRNRMGAVTVALAFLFIWQADFWLATPDVAGTLANKGMDLVDSPTVESPAWLRIAVGAMLAFGLITTTAFARACWNEGEDRIALAVLKETDSTASRQLRHSIWAKRGKKITLMLLLGAMFAYLFSFDVERARLTLDIQEIERGAAEWENVGLGLLVDQNLLVHAVPAAETTAASIESRSAVSLALPSAVGYALLWLLHGVLLMLPMPSRRPLGPSMRSTSDDAAA